MMELVWMLAVFGLMTCELDAHSWIACTDYRVNNAADWNPDDCRAFPRHGHQYTPKNEFGVDKGYNIINPPDNAPCRTERNDATAYNNDYPKAVYYRGQTVVIAHPTKNHVADTGCTNKYIPDNGNFIWRGPKDAQSDVSLTQFRSNEVANLGIGPNGYQVPDADTRKYPKAGFMNAPKFCDNPDKAMATNMFTIPQDLEAGSYTFMWGWLFNSETDLYTSCWEVDIVNTMAERDTRLTARGQQTGDATNTGDEDTPAPVPTMGPTPAATLSPSPGAGGDDRTECPCKCDSNPATHVTAGFLLLLVAMATAVLMSH